MAQIQDVLVLHGGNVYENDVAFVEYLKKKEVDLEQMRPLFDWKMSLQDKLGDKYRVIQPRMPVSDKATYNLWKLWFERIVPLLNDDFVTVGHSLGGLFLMKYFATEKLHRRTVAFLSVAAPFADQEDKAAVASGFALPDDLSRITQNVPSVLLFHSKDDQIVRFKDLAHYSELLPAAKCIPLDSYGHFLGADFPEIVEHIRGL